MEAGSEHMLELSQEEPFMGVFSARRQSAIPMAERGNYK
jgi:hypothetical protein